MRKVSTKGFTLLEILIALFIFTLLSMMMVGGLHSVINAQGGTEKNAERLRGLQMALLIMSRDIEQAINRPVRNSAGKEVLAFVGTPHEFTFTHMGFANPTGEASCSSLQRVRFYWNEENDSLWRVKWVMLDQAPTSQPVSRRLLTDVTETGFQYLAENGHFYDNWPPEDQQNQLLPRAVRIHLTISQWGKIRQLYVISAKATQHVQTSSTSS